MCLDGCAGGPFDKRIHSLVICLCLGLCYAFPAFLEGPCTEGGTKDGPSVEERVPLRKGFRCVSVARNLVARNQEFILTLC